MTSAIDGVTRPSRSSWRTLAALVFLLAVTAAFYWKLTISRDYTYLEGPDLAIQVRPWLDYQAREFHAGRFPLWDPYEWGGQPLAGQVQPGTFNPLNWILFAMPLEGGHIPIRTLHWYWVLIHWVGAAFCYALCRDLKAGVGASLLGASIFALTGFVGHTDWPQILMSAIWIPLVLLFFARVVRGERPHGRNRGSAALCGAALAMQFLSGHHQVPVFTALLLGGLWAWLVVSNWKKHLPHFLYFAAVFGLMSAVQVLPAVEYGKQAVRWAGAPEPLHWNEKVPFSVHAEYSLQWSSIPGMVIPGISLHANPFVGIVAMALALAAIGLGWRQPHVRLFAAVALGGLLLALGKDFPLYRLIYATVPMVEKARFPAMAVVLAQVGIAVLAALGLEALRTGRRSKILVCGLVGFSGAVLSIYVGLARLHGEPANYGAAIVAVVALALAAVLATVGRGRMAGALVFILFLIEAVTAAPRLARFDRRDSYAHMVESQQDIAAFLRAQTVTEPGWFRFEVDDAEIPYNFGVFHGLEQFGGGVSSMLARVHRILGHDETPRLFGIRYRVARTSSNAAQVPAQVPVFESRSGLKVYRDPRIGEPLWTVHPSPCGAADGAPDRLRVVTRLPEVFAIDADMACAGQVVAGDPWFPGWRAWVDGRRARIVEAEGVVRGVAVETGRHRIEFRYRPGSVYWGAALCALGILLTACLWAQDRRGARGGATSGNSASGSR